MARGFNLKRFRAERHKRCFISAPFGTDTTLIVRALEKRGTSASRLDDLRVGTSILASLMEQMKAADFVCVVFPSSVPNPNVLFELGVATGLQLPVLILADGESTIPSDLRGLAYARIRLDDSRLVEDAIDSFIRHPKQQHPAGRMLDSELKAIDVDGAAFRLKKLVTTSKYSTGSALERFVAGLFRQAGIVVRESPAVTDTGADLAIWLEGADDILGNPILVEVKGRVDTARFRAVEEQAAKWARLTGSQCLLVICLERVLKVGPVVFFPSG